MSLAEADDVKVKLGQHIKQYSLLVIGQRINVPAANVERGNGRQGCCRAGCMDGIARSGDVRMARARCGGCDGIINAG